MKTKIFISAVAVDSRNVTQKVFAHSPIRKQYNFPLIESLFLGHTVLKAAVNLPLRLNLGNIQTKEEIFLALAEGIEVYTVTWNNESAKWVEGQRVIQKGNFLTTAPDGITLNNLDYLPRFYS